VSFIAGAAGAGDPAGVKENTEFVFWAFSPAAANEGKAKPELLATGGVAAVCPAERKSNPVDEAPATDAGGFAGVDVGVGKTEDAGVDVGADKNEFVGADVGAGANGVAGFVEVAGRNGLGLLTFAAGAASVPVGPNLIGFLDGSKRPD
jgi:hypothetical protein